MYLINFYDSLVYILIHSHVCFFDSLNRPWSNVSATHRIEIKSDLLKITSTNTHMVIKCVMQFISASLSIFILNSFTPQKVYGGGVYKMSWQQRDKFRHFYIRKKVAFVWKDFCSRAHSVHTVGCIWCLRHSRDSLHF